VFTPFVHQDTSLGLSWREENELKKALYASLQQKRQRQNILKPPYSDSELTQDTPSRCGGQASSGISATAGSILC
jgi:hypothetical protein